MSKRHVRFGWTAVLFALAVPSTAQVAPDTMAWNVVGGWDISYYPEAKGCQAFALFERETAFFIGFDDTEARRSLNVTLIDQAWTQIEDGVEYPVQVRFGSNPAWTLDMDGRVMNGYPALTIHIEAGSREAEQFVREFRQEAEMQWGVGGDVLARLTLRGSLKAFDEVIACQDADHPVQTSVLPVAETPTTE